MTDPDDEDDETIVMHLVDDAVVANPNPIRPLLALEGNAPRWARLVCENLDGSPDSLLLTPRKSGEGLHRATSDLDLAPAHASPRSALTSSHGT